MAIWLLLGARVCRIDQGLKPRNIVGVGQVDDINGHIVLLESHAQILEIVLRSSNGVTHKDDNPLALRLILAMLQGELGDLDCREHV